MKQVTVSNEKSADFGPAPAAPKSYLPDNELKNNHKSSWCQFLKVGRIRAALNYLSEHKGP
jgi:hypothetical protein